MVLAVALSAGLACTDLGQQPPPAPIPQTPLLSVDDITIAEGSGGTFTISLSSAAMVDVVFAYFVGGGTASKVSDYLVTNDLDTLTLTPGTTVATVNVSVVADAVVEPDETFTITLTAISGTDLLDGTGVCTIPGSTPAGVSFATEVRPILQSRCATSGCHGAGFSSGGLTLGNATYSQVRNAVGSNGTIISGTLPSASLSNLYRVTTASPPTGIDRMPPVGGFLSTTQQNLIRDWIDQGALDN